MNTAGSAAFDQQPGRELVLEPIEQVDLPTLIYRVLRSKVFSGELAPGAKLDLDYLERALRVSRTPINSALIRLSEEGLVDIVPRRGTFIRELTTADVAEVWDIRRALELLAAEVGMANVDEDNLRHARTLLDNLAASRRAKDEAYVESAALDRDYHLALVGLARSRRLVETYKALHVDVINARIFYHGRLRAWEETDAEHRAILKAYEARDVEAAKSAITAACLNAKTVLLRRIEELGGSI